MSITVQWDSLLCAKASLAAVQKLLSATETKDISKLGTISQGKYLIT